MKTEKHTCDVKSEENNQVSINNAQAVKRKMPGWGWIFVVLHILNCFTWLFGILGLVVVVGVTKQAMEIAADEKKSTKQRVIDSVKFWLRTTIVDIFVGGMLYGLLFLFLYFMSYM